MSIATLSNEVMDISRKFELWQSYNLPSATESNLNVMGNLIHGSQRADNITTTNKARRNRVHISLDMLAHTAVPVINSFWHIYTIWRHSITMTSWWVRWRLIHQPHDCLLDRWSKAQIEENIKAPRHWPLCGWFPRTKGQWRGKCFHLMTSSWILVNIGTKPIPISQKCIRKIIVENYLSECIFCISRGQFIIRLM